MTALTKPIRLTDIATEFGLSIDTLYDYVRAGKLKARKIGIAWFVHPDDWDAFLRDDESAS